MRSVLRSSVMRQLVLAGLVASMIPAVASGREAVGGELILCNASGVRSAKVMSRPCAWSSFLALITGGMNAPSDGALKMTMESLSRVWAWDEVAKSANAAHDARIARNPITFSSRSRRS